MALTVMAATGVAGTKRLYVWPAVNLPYGGTAIKKPVAPGSDGGRAVLGASVAHGCPDPEGVNRHPR